MIEVSQTSLEGVLLIKLDFFKDFRGKYVEIYNQELYRKHGINVPFVQDDISLSKKNVLRGIHGDNQTWKLVSCLYGEFFLAVVNCDTQSGDFGKWQAFVLSDREETQVLLPPNYGNGHLVLSEKCIFHYKQSTYYNPKIQFTYQWNDQRFNINWPIRNPILSKRDELGYIA